MKITKRIAFSLLLAALLAGLLPVRAEDSQPELPTLFAVTDASPRPLSAELPLTPGQLVGDSAGAILESNVYGSVVNYRLYKGRTLSLSDPNYVFSVRVLENGNYSTVIKPAGAASYTATADMTVACLVRKAVKSPMTAEELAAVTLRDTQYGMTDVPGSVHRFTVRARTITGGLATTRAAIFLPESYSPEGAATPLVIMTNGRSGYLTDSVWDGNSTDNAALMDHYMKNGYAVVVVNNTAGYTGGADDWGNPQLVDSYWKAYAYVQSNFNLEECFALHGRGMGTLAAVRMMREQPQLVKCALLCGPELSLEAGFDQAPAFLAGRYGFSDTSGAVFEADKVAGYDPCTDVDGPEYTLPPTFWMMAEEDALQPHLATISKIMAQGNQVAQKIYADTDHSGVCRLGTEACRADALAFLQQHQTSTADHRFGPWSVTTAPSCISSGVLIRVCADCGYREPRVIPALTTHSFAGGGTCSGCGLTLAELYRGKVISILSASTSTFAGYIPEADGFNLAHRARYPQDDLLTDVNETWWMQLIDQLGAKLGINDSWAGSQVLNTRDTNSGDLGPDAAMASLTRIQNLGANGTPDLILFFGAGNDIGRGVPLGSFDPATAPTEADLTAVKWDTLAEAYTAALLRLKHFYPDAQIVAMTTYAMPGYATAAKLDTYGPVLAAICKYYGVPLIDLREAGVTFDMLPDNIHPDANGMDKITETVLEALAALPVKAGEHTVYTVTHDLTNTSASLGHYKGISAGKPFAETLSGDELTVTVTMGGADITATACAEGRISIPAVTGDIVITAKAPFTADGHLQPLPETVCPGTNLWAALEPENIYYTADGWGNTGAGNSWSVTFPVKPGDRIQATSLGSYPGNGSTANGVRITWFDENGLLKTMSRDAVYAEFAKNGYVTAPAGAVALNLPMTGNSADYEICLLTSGHNCSNGTCPGCGLTLEELSRGKVISVLGDSISTFAGYIPVADGFNLEHLPRYPQDNLLTDVNETWWMQVITRLEGKLGINDSWRGATVSGAAPVTSGSTGANAAMANLTRIQNLGSNGTPDLILFYGGTNDLAHVAKVGTFDPAAAPDTVDLTTASWDNLADGYVHTLLRLRHYYPEAQILCLLPTYTSSYYTNDKLAQANTVLAAICEHYGVAYTDLQHCGLTTADLPDGIHPDANGMDHITAAVLEALSADCRLQAGEHTVHSVTHALTGAVSSHSYIKGISAGKPFEALITGRELTVTVTMGGADITAAAYAEGRIAIPAVTGDLVITATGRETPIHEEHLQPLPEAYCSGTNLWTALTPENTYYTGSGWGNLSGNLVWSVTIPVEPGQQLWATSFQAYGPNGNTFNKVNGIRLTWFDSEGVLRSVNPEEVHAEFAQNGRITVPQGAAAANIVMWDGSPENQLFLLSAGHSYGDYVRDGSGDLTAVCTCCGHGDTKPDPAIPYRVDSPVLAEDACRVTVTNRSRQEGGLLCLAAYTAEGRFLGLATADLSGLAIGQTDTVALPLPYSGIGRLRATVVASLSDPTPLSIACTPEL